MAEHQEPKQKHPEPVKSPHLKAYKEAYVQAGGGPDDVQDDQALTDMMAQRNIQTDEAAKEAGQKDGLANKRRP